MYALKSFVTHTKFGPLIGEEVKTLETEGLFPEWRVGYIVLWHFQISENYSDGSVGSLWAFAAHVGDWVRAWVMTASPKLLKQVVTVQLTNDRQQLPVWIRVSEVIKDVGVRGTLKNPWCSIVISAECRDKINSSII